MNKKYGTKRFIIYIAAFLILLLVYFWGTKKLISPAYASIIELACLAILILVFSITMVMLLVTTIHYLISNQPNNIKKKINGQMITIVSVLCLVAIIAAFSQLTAHTPAIRSENGEPLSGSIAEVEKVKLGGVDQWLIIRGVDINKPVLLFLSGGPGASEAARVIRFNAELEKHFVVVIWEQRGCGKSYPSINPKSSMTIDQYVSDLVELTDLLRERFDEEKIYLIGHSWGTIIGVRAAQARPDLYHAYVGASQMVDLAETDQLIYKTVLADSQKSGDQQFVSTLIAQGEPPYFGKNPISPYSTLFGKEYTLYEYPNIQSEEYRRNGDILMLMLKQPEYGWMDRVYYLLGLMNTFNLVYPQLQDMDFRQDAVSMDLPVYLILGRHDMNNPSPIPEDYFNLLQAPSKKLFYFEKSGHGMIWEEPDLFTNIMVNTVLPETFPL